MNTEKKEIEKFETVMLTWFVNTCRRAETAGRTPKTGTFMARFDGGVYNRAANRAARNLSAEGYLVFEEDPFTDLVVKMRFLPEKADDAERRLAETSGFVPESDKRFLLERLVCEYGNMAYPAVATVAGGIKNQLVKGRIHKDWREQEDVLKSLAFIESNTTPLYEYEMSAKVFGDTKYFGRDGGPKSRVRTLLRNAYNRPKEYGESDDDIFTDFLIIRPSSLVYIKGPVKLTVNGTDIDAGACAALENGTVIGERDLFGTENVRLGCGRFVTVENLSSYKRMSGRNDTVWFYLGGFCSGSRRDFLQIVHRDNPDVRYMHFGDTDPDGFRILEDLKRRTGIPFEPLGMDADVLNRHRKVLKPLTENDRELAGRLAGEGMYRNELESILSAGGKLEQENVREDELFENPDGISEE